MEIEVARADQAARRGRFSWIAYLCSFLLLLGAIALLWWPVVSHYRVKVGRIDNSIIDLHRSTPTDDVLTVVADVSMMTDHPLSGDDAVAAAERILRGELSLPALPVLPFDPTFSPDDLVRGVPVQQIWMASLIVPDLLLRAYEHTHNEVYLKAADRYLSNFIDYEARQWRPTGLLWNAHAVSNRAAILSRYWKFVRGDSVNQADAETARRVHSHAMRLGALLLKREMFVGMTNHGVMQNVALLQLAVAFPSLPESQLYRETALSRLNQQLPFYINDEGAVLEHSAGYHFHGVVLTGFLMRLLPLAGEPVPERLSTAHNAARDLLQQLQRPDRSLPLIGNTYRYAWQLPALLEPRDESSNVAQESFTALHPSAGYAIRFDREATASVPSHTTVHWGYFPGHGHARAQEMSLHIWAGTEWSTNTGYWPGNDDKGISLSDGWDGGNGPHVVGEQIDRSRQTKLLGAGQLDDIHVLDLARTAQNGLIVRRQIVQVGGATWIVLDTFSDPTQRPLRVLWTAAPEATVTARGENKFDFENEASPMKLSLELQGTSSTATVVRGSREPFGGWVAFDRKAHPAPSVDARSLAAPSAWMASVLRLTSKEPSSVSSAHVSRFDNPELWEIGVVDGTRRIEIRRNGSEIAVQETGAAIEQRTKLETHQAVADSHAEIAAAGEKVRSMYPRVRLFEEERSKVFVVIIASWVAMLICLFAVLRFWNALHRTAFTVVHVGWICGVSWLLFNYLQS